MGFKPRATSINEQTILEQLDRYAESFDFPVLDNGYIHLAAARLHCFRSETHWALLIEQFGFSNRCEGHERISAGAYAYGNCVAEPGLNSIYSETKTGKYEPRIGSDPTKDGPEELFADSVGEDGYETDWVNPRAKSVLVRGSSIEVVHERAVYESRGIKLEDSKRIYVFELLRALVVEHKNKFLFSDAQLRKILPRGIQKVLQLEEWHHIGQDGWGKPSESETFQMLAKVLVTGDPKEYRPSQSANTHWSHWPEGGQL